MSKRARKIYCHPETGEIVSRQRAWQLKLEAQGRCVRGCGQPARAGRRLCCGCALKMQHRRYPHLKKTMLHEHPTAAAWTSVDWSQSNRAIAQQLKVMPRTVQLHRRKTLGGGLVLRVQCSVSESCGAEDNEPSALTASARAG